MTARFLFLENGGSPTRWDATRYFDYLKGIRGSLPDDLRSLTAPERFDLPSSSALSFWRSDVTFFHVDPENIRIGAINDYGTRRFEFCYSGVQKIQTTTSKLYFMPSIVMQELVLMRGGLIRHTFSDMAGNFTTIYSSGL